MRSPVYPDEPCAGGCGTRTDRRISILGAAVPLCSQEGCATVVAARANERTAAAVAELDEKITAIDREHEQEIFRAALTPLMLPVQPDQEKGQEPHGPLTRYLAPVGHHHALTEHFAAFELTVESERRARRAEWEVAVRHRDVTVEDLRPKVDENERQVAAAWPDVSDLDDASFLLDQQIAEAQRAVRRAEQRYLFWLDEEWRWRTTTLLTLGVKIPAVCLRCGLPISVWQEVPFCSDSCRTGWEPYRGTWFPLCRTCHRFFVTAPEPEGVPFNDGDSFCSWTCLLFSHDDLDDWPSHDSPAWSTVAIVRDRPPRTVEGRSRLRTRIENNYLKNVVSAPICISSSSVVVEVPESLESQILTFLRVRRVASSTEVYRRFSSRQGEVKSTLLRLAGTGKIEKVTRKKQPPAGRPPILWRATRGVQLIQ